MKKILLLFQSAIFIATLSAQPTEIPLKGITDGGVYYLIVNDTRIGTIDFQLDANGNYRRKMVLEIGGQKAEFQLEISSTDGIWQKMKVTVPGKKEAVIIKRMGNEAQIEVSGESKVTFSIKSQELIYDNYGPALEAFLLKSYDLHKGGEQTFTRNGIPQHFESKLSFLGEEYRTLNGSEQKLLKFKQLIGGIEIQIWANQEYCPLLEYVPAQRAVFVRKGYEQMLSFLEEDPLLSKATYQITKQTVMIPMRDGVRLATDLYLPKGEEKFPVILIRTPYKKEMAELYGNFYARRGYAVAIQDCRGRFSSEGRWTPFLNEGRDGYDSVEWLAAQPFANRKVGMIGGSYVGWVQLWAAVEKPPHLVTIIPNVTPPDPFYNIPYEYGSFFTLGAIWWAEILEKNASADLSGATIAQINSRKYERILRQLPVIKLDKKILGKKNRYWREWIEHNSNDNYWQQVNFMQRLKDLNLPVFLQSGWFDGDGIGSKLNYRYLRQSQNPYIKLILGPWGHTDSAHSQVGEYDFGVEAAPDLYALYLKWFDYWLKGIDNGIIREPLVNVFVMFANRWLKGNNYPLENSRFTPLYLTSEQGANGSRGDGQLLRQPPEKQKEFDSYIYNPADPTPCPMYYFKSDAELERDKKEGVKAEEEFQKIQQFYKKTVAERKDILVFDTPPFEKEITIAGPLELIIYASSSAPDTDWFGALYHIDETGKVLQLSRGTLRARFRNSLSQPELLSPNQVYEFKIDLWQTGIMVKKGCKLRLEVSSAFFPLFSRNLNTGGHNEKEKRWKIAENRIYHSERYPSRLILPLIELDNQEK